MRKQSLPVRLAFLSLALIGILAFASSAAFGQAVITIVNGDALMSSTIRPRSIRLEAIPERRWGNSG